MKALILCAGYATRMFPLTEDRPKALLPVAGKALLDHLLEKVEAVPEINTVYLVTNARFADQFEEWRARRPSGFPVEVINDTTTEESLRLGAIGDLAFVIDAVGLDDDVLILAGDNLFSFDLGDFVTFFKGSEPCVAVYDVGSKELVRKYSEVRVDDGGRVVHYEEKPAEPSGTLAGIGLYLLPRKTLPRVAEYLKEGNNPDQPGRFFQWLFRREEVRGFRVMGEWYDIGELDQYASINRKGVFAEPTIRKQQKTLEGAFRKFYGAGDPLRFFLAPGRVNLLGEHTDYNGGFVLPMAIDRHLLVAARTNGHEWIEVGSLNIEGRVRFPLHRISFDPKEGWANYPKGVARILVDRGHRLTGMDLLVWGRLPLGGGLSSSGALEVAICQALTLLSGIHLAPEEMARVCQKAENDFVGMRSGIMDQLVIACAKPGCVLFLDCRTLAWKHIPLASDRYAIVVVNSRKNRQLLSEDYNARRSECEKAMILLRNAGCELPDLCSLDSGLFEKLTPFLPAVLKKRVRHVVSENQRVVQGKEHLREGRFEEFGRLMNESHESLRNFFEVSCPELDTLVRAAREVEGVAGSRMTGAGFGGCTVSLVARPAIPEFRRHVSASFEKEFGFRPDIDSCQAVGGAGEIE